MLTVRRGIATAPSQRDHALCRVDRTGTNFKMLSVNDREREGEDLAKIADLIEHWRRCGFEFGRSSHYCPYGRLNSLSEIDDEIISMETLIHDDEIKLLLQPFGIDKLHHSDDVLIAIKANFTIVYVNFGWYRFAANNGGMTQEALIIPFGRSLFDFIPEALHPFFKYHFSVCLESRQPWQHKYECSTGEVFREYLMTVYPLGEGQGFLISHSLAFSGPHDRQRSSPIERNYFSPSGVIVQCVHCRRVKRSDANLSWDWVPEWVTATHPNVSHGVCETCVTYYYPGGKIPADGYYPKMVQSAGLPALQGDDINAGS